MKKVHKKGEKISKNVCRKSFFDIILHFKVYYVRAPKTTLLKIVPIIGISRTTVY